MFCHRSQKSVGNIVTQYYDLNCFYQIKQEKKDKVSEGNAGVKKKQVKDTKSGSMSQTKRQERRKNTEEDETERKKQFNTPRQVAC